MPLNPRRAFNALLEGPLRLNEDACWALYDGDEELTYWDEGQPMEMHHEGAWVAGVVGWDGQAYALDLPGGTQLPIVAGLTARRRVGGSV